MFNIVITSEDTLFLLSCKAYNYISNKTFVKSLILRGVNISEIFSNSVPANIFLEDKEKINNLKEFIDINEIKKLKEELEKKKIKYISFIDKNYPEKLKKMDDPPFGIFYKGNIEKINSKKIIAIVGTRKPTSYGINNTKKISLMLNELDIVIVSGMAGGVDTVSHENSLRNGNTIAVLGTGVDVIYPASNRSLYEKIISSGGLAISEYPMGLDGQPWNFPQRNRIISALSDAVVVIEGDTQSGALITAKFAIKQDKKLFALPGPIDSPMSNGPNILIKSRAAELLTSVNDVLEDVYSDSQMKIPFKLNEKDISSLNEKQKEIYKSISSSVKFDELLNNVNLNTSELIQELTVLELKGFIEKSLDGNYVKV